MSAKKAAPGGRSLSPCSPVTDLPGFGPKRAALLAKLGLTHLGDFPGYFPRDYEDRTTIYPLSRAPQDLKVCFRLIIANDPVLSRLRQGMQLVKVRAFDHTGSVEIVFFNRPYTQKQLEKGREYIFYGKIENYPHRPQLINPLFEEIGEDGEVTGRILPIYPLSAGISSSMVEQGVRTALQVCPVPESAIPETIAEKMGLMDNAEAYTQIHFPHSLEEAAEARRRFIFEELYTFCCASVGLKWESKTRVRRPMQYFDPEEFYQKLPFTPTDAQKRAIADAFADMTSPNRMNRLVQGDVGSGKTLVAAACAWLCRRNKRQAVIMAPTELLARQHQKTLTGLLAPFGMQVGLLVSAMPTAEKKAALMAAANGTFDLICGTHALIQNVVEFTDPALFVVDEQHRFGVAQRSALAKKQPDSHMLVMSATPIPRTLSLIIFGDLDLSIIDQMPRGRLPIETYSIGEDKRRRMESFLLKQVQEGGQAYIVCPLIEESEVSDRQSAEEYITRLSKALPMLRIGLMHGKLPAKEKEAVMAEFAAGMLDVLVSTTVIEVGIDVPNANLMIIENAESFGLSQLHQLRGRVGRGKRQSYCILMRKGSRTPRLDVICKTADGFKVAEEDLKLRGPGDFFGNRQHGLPAFRLADLSADLRVFEQARTAAEETFRRDPGLELPEHAALRTRVMSLLQDESGIKRN
ncbi:MAG: ATP-dependent DNA helicase RecG [Clostridia bacterium]|nr:ATP-dependent DNA helicase RecG [Clostridia bacterium]